MTPLLDGIKGNMVDIEYFLPMMNSTRTSDNQFEANIQFVEDNTAYFKRIIHRFNRDILDKVSSLTDGAISVPRFTNEMLYVSLPKYMYGNIHEPHSYLLE